MIARFLKKFKSCIKIVTTHILTQYASVLK
jgi:hypothetical protein